MAEKILIISPVDLFPGHAGNKTRIIKVCSALMEMGYELDFYYTGFQKNQDPAHKSFFNGKILESDVDSYPITESLNLRTREIWNGIKIKKELLKRLFLDGILSAKYNQSLYNFKNVRKVELLKRQLTNTSYKAVIVNYAVYSHYFDLFDDEIQKIIDVHDCLTDRFRLYIEQGEKPVAWYSIRRQDDRQALQKADIIWAITDKERNYYQNLTGKPTVYTLRHLEKFAPVKSLPGSSNILMVASDNKLNLDGLKWFLSKVWPRVLANVRDAKLIIAGSICKRKKIFSAENVEFFGRYDSDEEIYSMGDICINPMQAGTGLKIKTLEALARGKVVVSASAGASGLDDLAGHGLICHNDAEHWILELCRLLMNPELISEAKNGLEETITKIYEQNLTVIRKSVYRD